MILNIHVQYGRLKTDDKVKRTDAATNDLNVPIGHGLHTPSFSVDPSKFFDDEDVNARPAPHVNVVIWTQFAKEDA